MSSKQLQSKENSNSKQVSLKEHAEKMALRGNAIMKILNYDIVCDDCFERYGTFSFCYCEDDS